MDQNLPASRGEPDIFDTIIIGAGPAGISAAIYAVRKNLKVLILTKTIGGQAAISGDIENYLGFSMITGPDLAKKFREELVNFENKGLWVEEGVEVIDLSGADPNFSVKTSDKVEYHGKTIIISSGRIPKMLGIPGERELLGKGVANCATCDAPFYKDKDVAIVGGGNSSLDAAFSLIKVARYVTIVNITETLQGDEILLKNVTSSSKVKVLNNHEALEILGDQAVGGIKVKDKVSGGEQVLPVSGVFIEIGWKPSTSFDKLTNKNEIGEIEVDDFGATSVPGIYAAGDVNNIWGEQIVIAAGEGAKTALRVAEHLLRFPPGYLQYTRSLNMRYTHGLKIIRKRKHAVTISLVITGVLIILILVLGFSALDAQKFFFGFFESLTRVTVAYLISLALALVLTLLVSSSRRVEEISVPILDVMQSFPAFALFPLFVLWFGKTAIVTILILIVTMIWPILFTILSAQKQLKIDLIEAAHSFGARGWKFLIYVLFPLLFPAIITGSIVSWGEAWEAIIAAEIIVNIPGVGTYLAQNGEKLNSTVLFIGILLLLMLLFILNKYIWLPLLNMSTKYQQE